MRPDIPDQENEDEDEDDDDNVVITTERAQTEDEQHDGEGENHSTMQGNNAQSFSMHNTQQDQTQGFGFDQNMSGFNGTNFGNMNMNGFNPMMAMQGFGMGMPGMMGKRYFRSAGLPQAKTSHRNAWHGYGPIHDVQRRLRRRYG